MGLGPRIDLRVSQQLVMTQQLQQAIKLLALSNLEIEAVIAEELAKNPLLEARPGEGATGQDVIVREDREFGEEAAEQGLVAGGLGEPHLLADRQVLQLAFDHAVAVEVDLAPVGGGNEAVVALRDESGDDPVRRGLVRLHRGLELAHVVLELAPGRIDGVADRHVGVLVPAGHRRLAGDVDVPAAGHSVEDPPVLHSEEDRLVQPVVVDQLVRNGCSSPAEALVRLLQGDNVRVHFVKDVENALRVAPADGADRLSNVVAGHGERGYCSHDCGNPDLARTVPLQNGDCLSPRRSKSLILILPAEWST